MLFDTVFIVSIAPVFVFSCLHELKRDVLNNGNASKLDHNILTSGGEGCHFFFFLFSSFHFYNCIDLSYCLQRDDYDTVLFSQVNGSCAIFSSEGKDQGWVKQNAKLIS